MTGYPNALQRSYETETFSSIIKNKKLSNFTNKFALNLTKLTNFTTKVKMLSNQKVSIRDEFMKVDVFIKIVRKSW